MDWANIYALGWLICSALFALEAAATFTRDELDEDRPRVYSEDYNEEDEALSYGNRLAELYDDLEDTLGFMSVESMQNSMLGISGFLLLLDCAGFLLAWEHIHRTPAHLAFIGVTTVLYVISAMEMIIFMHKLFGAFARPTFSYEIMKRYIRLYRLDQLFLPKYVSKLAIMGKFVVSLYLFMTLFNPI